MHVDPAYADTLAACGLGSIAAVLERVEGQIVAWSRTTDTLFVPGPGGQPGVYVKRCGYPSLRKRMRGAFRGTLLGKHRGRAEFELLAQMRDLGISAVRPLAYGARRTAGLVSACFLITEEAPGAVNLTTFASDVQAGRVPLSPAQRRRMLSRLAREIARLHETGFAHGQLYWRNILIRVDPNGEPEYFFLDPRPGRGLRVAGRRPTWWIDELAQVSASAEGFTSGSERFNFLQEYLHARRLDLRPRALMRRITLRARRWAAHEAQRLRMSDLFSAWNRRLAQETGAAPPGEAAS
jgi:hypothetical protein